MDILPLYLVIVLAVLVHMAQSFVRKVSLLTNSEIQIVIFPNSSTEEDFNPLNVSLCTRCYL